MTPLTEKQEEALKEEYRKIFYAGLLPTIESANERPAADVFDLVRGKHSMSDVLFGFPPTGPADKVMIYPLRTYELIRELKAKEQNDGNSPSSRDQQTEAIA